MCCTIVKAKFQDEMVNIGYLSSEGANRSAARLPGGLATFP